MELRLIVAYALLALLVLFGASLAAWLRYHSHQRTTERNRRRDREAYERRTAAGAESGD